MFNVFSIILFSLVAFSFKCACFLYGKKLFEDWCERNRKKQIVP